MRLRVVARAGLTGWCAAVIAVHTRGVVTSENNNVYKNKKAGYQVKNLGRLCATLPLVPSSMLLWVSDSSLRTAAQSRDEGCVSDERARDLAV